jgi:aspartate aminotransferase
MIVLLFRLLLVKLLQRQRLLQIIATRLHQGFLSCVKRSLHKTKRDSNYEITVDQVLVTNGGKQAVYQAFATIIDPGDEVLLPSPYWTTYPEAIKLAGGKSVEVFADETQNYLVTVEQLEAARTPKTKALLFCSPSNPTGSVYSPEQVKGDWRMGG